MNNQKTNNASMSEQELLTDLLHSERDAVKQYASNCTESGCENLRSLLINCMTECSEDQLAVFEQMKQRNMHIKMLQEASRLLKCYSTLQRELVLEEVRKRFFPELPSRKNALYLCDHNQLEHWKDELTIKGKNIDLFKVEVTGNLFKSSDILLPDNGESINTMFEQAKKYWEADLTDISDEKSEYLFSGKVKVLEKI